MNYFAQLPKVPREKPKPPRRQWPALKAAALFVLTLAATLYGIEADLSAYPLPVRLAWLVLLIQAEEYALDFILRRYGFD